MRSILLTVILYWLTMTSPIQEEWEPTPHVTDPAQCTSYCYPHGGPNTRPKGTPEGIPGSECTGPQCAKVNDDPDGEDHCNDSGCSKWCSKVCCTCLQVCM